MIYTINGKEASKEEFCNAIGSGFAVQDYLFFPALKNRTEELLSFADKWQDKFGRVEGEFLNVPPIEKEKDGIGKYATRADIKQMVKNAPEPEEMLLDWSDLLAILKSEDNKGENSFSPFKNKSGKKETDGKLYYEFDWEFIEAVAQRMQDNKGDKYHRWNWKSPIDIESIRQAINRHHIEVMKGNYRDGEDELGHIVAYATNAMILWHQLKNK